MRSINIILNLLFIFILNTSCSIVFLEEFKIKHLINLNISENGVNGIYLQWQVIPTANYYQIQRGNTPEELQVHVSKMMDIAWMDDQSIPGILYYYRVIAYDSKEKEIGKSTILYGKRPYLPIDSVTEPVDFKVTEKEYNDKIKLCWIGKEGNTYRIYRSLRESDDFILIGETSNYEFIDEDVSKQSTYFYKISSVGQNSFKEIEEKYYPYTIEGSRLYNPTGVKASINDINYGGYIYLSWDLDPVASYFEIYRSSEKDGEYQLISPFVKQNNYIDMDVEFENSQQIIKYYYRVVAVSPKDKSIFSEPAEGSAINPNFILPAPENININVDKSAYPYKIELSWNSVPGAINYKIFKNDNDTLLPITTTSSTTISLPNELFGKSIEFIIEPRGSSPYPNKKGKIIYTSIIPSPPYNIQASVDKRIYHTNITETNAPTKIYVGAESGIVGTVTKVCHIFSEVGMIDISWDQAPESVEYYNIYRSNSENGPYKVIAKSTTTTFRDDLFFHKENKVSLDTEGAMIYPVYYYKISAVFSGSESLLSESASGSAINPKNILQAPNYLSIPFHWASGNGYGMFFGSVASFLKQGEESPIGFHQLNLISDRLNFLYLTWEAVAGANEYLVSHARGNNPNTWYTRSINQTKIRFNNQSLKNSQTGLYTFMDFLSYSPESVYFNVTPIYKHGNKKIEGDSIVIFFEEPSESPSVY